MQRRHFLTRAAGSATALSAFGRGGVFTAGAVKQAAIPDTFPRQDLEEVRMVVGASHSDLAKVREMVQARPALAKAAWDWGFGDWETPLDAASHTGQREIASFLISNGARLTLFSAAMLGQLDVVRSFIVASPGVQRTYGPHSITLLAHARAGGEPARAVVDYLESLGDADVHPELVKVDAAARAAYVGTYTFGPGPTDAIEVSENKEILRVGRTGGTPRNLFARGAHLFHPAGAPAVRIQFAVRGAVADQVTITDGSSVLTATRKSS